MKSKSPPAQKTYTHSQLCSMAVTWLRKSSGAHACTIAVSEVKSGTDGEIPDAIGFRYTGDKDGCVVVECKTSRSDFLADLKKNHRQDAMGRELNEKGVLGMGKWRYFLAPEGLISVDELPHKWGLLTVTKRGSVKVVCGAAEAFKNGVNYFDVPQILNDWACEGNAEREKWVLVKLFRKLGSGDIEVMNKEKKEIMARHNNLAKRYEKLLQENSKLRDKLTNLRYTYGKLAKEEDFQLPPTNTFTPVLFDTGEPTAPLPPTPAESWEDFFNNPPSNKGT